MKLLNLNKCFKNQIKNISTNKCVWATSPPISALRFQRSFLNLHQRHHGISIILKKTNNQKNLNKCFNNQIRNFSLVPWELFWSRNKRFRNQTEEPWSHYSTVFCNRRHLLLKIKRSSIDWTPLFHRGISIFIFSNRCLHNISHYERIIKQMEREIPAPAIALACRIVRCRKLNNGVSSKEVTNTVTNHSGPLCITNA